MRRVQSWCLMMWRLLRKLLKRQTRVPRVMITDKLASYSAAKDEVMPSVEHRRHKGLNNRAENSHNGRSAHGSRAAVARRRDRVGPGPRVQDQPKHDHARAGR